MYFLQLFVAEIQGSIRATIPQIITLLGPREESDIHKAAASALSKLSEYGEISIFFT